MSRLVEIERKAINFIRNAEQLALRMDSRGFHVAFSGGKDSQVLLALVEMSGVRYHAEMQVTTVDSPNLMKFVRANYPQVHLNLPQINMRKLILKKKMLPTRQARFCCAYLKEQAGAGSCTCTGVRRYESVQRAKRHPVELFGKRTVMNQYRGQKGILSNYSVSAPDGIYKANSSSRKKVVNNYLKWIMIQKSTA